jgi:uncharacterized protein YlxW (UPF0749 family)
MSNETKIVKGGFRASLALLISIVALVFAIIAFNRTGGEADLRAQIRDLQARVKTLRKETSEKVTRVRQETTKALEKIGVEIKKEEPKKGGGGEKETEKKEGES